MNYELNTKQLEEQKNFKYLMDIFEKINSKQKLDEDDIKFLAFDCEDYIVNIEKSESGRWSYGKTLIINIQNNYFKFRYEVGLTENQDNDFSNTQIKKVFPIITQKIIYDTEWKECNEVN